MTRANPADDGRATTNRATTNRAIETNREGGESTSHAVTRAVATARGVEPTALPPLTERVDPDALDAMFGTATEAAAAELTFRYAGTEVVVGAGGSIDVIELTGAITDRGR